jgi:hypothetical protein
MASLAEQFKAKIPASLSSDAGQRKLNGFIKKSIKDQRGLLECLKEFSKAFLLGGDRYDESQAHRGLAILYSLFTRAIDLAGPMNNLADLVLYIAQLARELNGGPKGNLSLSLPSPEDIDYYLGYSVLWNQMPEQDRNVLEQEALKKRREIREPRTLITELVIAYSKKNNGQTPSLEQIYDFDPADKTPREELDAALEACNASWIQFSRAGRSPSAPVEKNMKRLDEAFDRLRRLLLRSGSEPLVFFQLMKWIRDGARPNVKWTGPESDQYVKETTPSWTNIWAEVYLEVCYCAIRLAMSKWNIYRVQKARGVSQKDLDFLLGPVDPSERDKFETRIAWGFSNTKGFEECNRVRRRMNRFAEASALTHLDEFETVALVNKIAEIKQNSPEQMEKMIAEASSTWVAFQDKHRVGQQILDSFTIVWTDQQNQDTRIIVEFHNMPCELFSTNSPGLGDLVRKAFWRKMAELSDQIIRFLLAYLEVLGLVADVISAGTANGFRQMVFEFVKERMKEKASDAVLDAFHIDNPALRTAAGIGMNFVRIGPKPKGQLEPSNPEIAGQRQAAIAGGKREPEFPKDELAELAERRAAIAARTQEADEAVLDDLEVPQLAQAPLAAGAENVGVIEASAARGSNSGRGTGKRGQGTGSTSVGSSGNRNRGTGNRSSGSRSATTSQNGTSSPAAGPGTGWPPPEPVLTGNKRQDRALKLAYEAELEKFTPFPVTGVSRIPQKGRAGIGGRHEQDMRALDTGTRPTLAIHSRTKDGELVQVDGFNPNGNRAQEFKAADKLLGAPLAGTDEWLLDPRFRELQKQMEKHQRFATDWKLDKYEWIAHSQEMADRFYSVLFTLKERSKIKIVELF